MAAAWRSCPRKGEHLRVKQHCAGNRDALLLSTRQGAAALADRCVIPLQEASCLTKQL